MGIVKKALSLIEKRINQTVFEFVALLVRLTLSPEWE